MKRLLALVAAVAMVAGAVALRSDTGGVREDPAPDDRDWARPAVLRLRCATELAEACRMLADGDDRIEVQDGPAGAYADALLDDPAAVPADMWLAPMPWVELVGAVGGGGALGAPTHVLARSPLVLVAFGDTVPGCGDGPVGWPCLGDGAADPGVGLRPGISGRDETEGLFAIASAGAAFFSTSAYATNDLDTVPEGGGRPFVDWAATLLAAVPKSGFGTPLATMLLTGSATYDVAATIEAVAAVGMPGTRHEASLRLIYPSPMATVDVVAVPVTAGDEGAAAELTRLLTGDEGAAALARAGWRVDGEPPEGVASPVPIGADDGLPAAGVLAALRDRLP